MFLIEGYRFQRMYELIKLLRRVNTLNELLPFLLDLFRLFIFPQKLNHEKLSFFDVQHSRKTFFLNGCDWALKEPVNFFKISIE